MKWIKEALLIAKVVLMDDFIRFAICVDMERCLWKNSRQDLMIRNVQIKTKTIMK